MGEASEELSYGVGAAAVPFDGKTRYLRITDIDDETHRFLENDISSPDPSFDLSESDYLKFGDREKDSEIVFAGFLIRAILLENYNSEFIYQQTLSEPYSKFVAVTSQRSGQPGINAQEYANWELWVCSEQEQHQIGTFFSQLDHLITLHQRKRFVLFSSA